MKQKLVLLTLLLTAAALVAVAMAQSGVGRVIDQYKGIKIYDNGIVYNRSYGKNYSRDGYYYGQKWQCVEFVKRFYAKAKRHKMPDVWGHAKDYFDSKLKDGALNRKRGLVQYHNGSAVKPKPDDILVFNDTHFGHIAIVSKVGSNYVEVVQQNIYRQPRERYAMVKRNGRYFIIDPKSPAGWLRKLRIKSRTLISATKAKAKSKQKPGQPERAPSAQKPDKPETVAETGAKLTQKTLIQKSASSKSDTGDDSKDKSD